MRNPRATKKQIKDVITLTTDLFGYIDYDLTDLEIAKEALNFYFISKYSNRWVSPVLELLMDSEGEISTADFTTLGTYINQLYKNKWDRLKNIILLEYDPIHNYSDSMAEDIVDSDDKSVTLDLDGTNSNTRTDNTTETTSNTRTDNTNETTSNTRTDNITRTDNLTRTDDLEQTRDVGTTDDRTDSVYGFNSSDAVPSEEKAGSGSVDETDTQSGTVRNTGTVTNTGTVSNAGTRQNTGTVSNAGNRQNTGTVGNSGSNTVDSTENTERDFTRTRSVTHIGNIGNIATQDLLEKEVEFWHWNFIVQMLSDVADVITLPIY